MSILTKKDIEDYLIYLYFGQFTDVVNISVEKAYLDFNRTLHGIQKAQNKDFLINKGKFSLENELNELISKKNILEQNSFDDWHKQACERLIHTFKDFKLYYGQAQKWINMSLKYIFILDINMVKDIYNYLHIPIDNIIMRNLEGYNPPKFNNAWSRIDNYQDYINFQYWIRENFNEAPMDIEFKVWLGEYEGISFKKENSK